MSVRAGLRRHRRVIWSVIAAALSFAVFAVTFQNADIKRLPEILSEAEVIWIFALAGSMPLEQLVRGWKWRQILYDIQPIGTLRLFGAVMAGYFANMVVPVGVSPLVRAWLVARLEDLKISTVLLTTAIERFVDGIVFALLVGILVVFATLPSAEENLRTGLVAAGAGGFAVFAGLVCVLILFKRRLLAPSSTSLMTRGVTRLEQAFDGKFAGLSTGIAQGITWPKSRWRGVGVVAASVGMKLISTTHFLWVGLAFGIVLAPFDYLLIMVIAGFAMIITRFVRLPAGGVIGAAFALKLLGVADEEALTMVLLVHAASLIMTTVVGAIALWKSGLTVVNLRQHLSRKAD